MSSFAGDVQALLQRAAEVLDGPVAEHLARLGDHIDDPLRVAVAGRLKAGKSTLLNAIVGEPLAATGTAECTRVVTWYTEGITYRATVVTTDGQTRLVQVRRGDTSVEIDLDGVDPRDIDRLVVEWPASTLRQLTLLDTPGIATLSAELSERTTGALLAQEPAADAVIYLLRHLHTSDAAFLDSWLASSGPAGGATAIGVLSRADEVGGAGPDAMIQARRIAARYADDHEIRQRCSDVIAVSGLLAQAATTLTAVEHRALATLADADRHRVDDLLLTATRFTGAEDGCGLTPGERAHLIQRLGLFGVRLSLPLLRLGVTTTAGELSAQLADRSGLTELRSLLESRFGARAGLLKARRAAHVLDRALVDADPRSPAAGHELTRLRSDLERLLATTHELEELRALAQLRHDGAGLPDGLSDQAARILGGSGAAPRRRLDLPDEVTADGIRQAVVDALARFQPVTVHPLSSPTATASARTVIRTLESLHAAVSSIDPATPTS